MFITLEGPEGSGKTAQVAPLADFLSRQGYNILTTREPGGTAIGNQVRDVLMSMENKAMHPRTETLLFTAARAQLVEQVIRPHLAAGGIVLSDRYANSTLAYQGYGHGFDRDMLRSLLDFATGNLWPDLTLLLDISAEDGLRRKRKTREWNRMDDYNLAFHQRVRAGYHELAAAAPGRWVIIDAAQPLDMVQSGLREAILKRLQQTNLER